MKIGATSTKDIHLVSFAHVPEADTSLTTFAENLSERLGASASTVLGSPDDSSEEKLSRRNGMGSSLLVREEKTSTQKTISVEEPLPVEPSHDPIQRTLPSQAKPIALQVQFSAPGEIAQESDLTKESVGEKGPTPNEMDSKNEPSLSGWGTVESNHKQLEIQVLSEDDAAASESKESAPIKDQPLKTVLALTEADAQSAAKDTKSLGQTKTSSGDTKNIRFGKDAKAKDKLSDSVNSVILIPISAESIVPAPVSPPVAVPDAVKSQGTKAEQILPAAAVTLASGTVALRNTDPAKSLHTVPVTKKDIGADAPTPASKNIQVPAADAVNKIGAEKDPAGTPAVSHPQEKDALALVMTSPHGAALLSQGAPVQDGHAAATGVTNLSPTHGVASTETPRSETQSFAALDRERTLTVTPTSIEVGIPGGSHGWLKLRAEMSTDGSIQASMSPSSLSHADELRRELPSLTMYLHQEQIPVSSLAVHEPTRAHSFSDMPGGMNLNSGTGGETHDSQNGEKRMQEFSRDEPVRFLAEPEEERTDWPLLSGGKGRGWLSVRA